MSGADGFEPLATHGRHAQAVLFSPDGRLLANAAADGRVRVWQV